MKFFELEAGKHKPAEIGVSPTEIPLWLDTNKFKRGQEFAIKQCFGIIMALHHTLAIGFGLPRLLEPLVYTEKSDTPKKSLKRYLETFCYLVFWFTGDVWDANSSAHKSVQNVRRMHNHTSKRMNQDERLIKQANVDFYFSQYDMSLVQSSFVALIILCPKYFGIHYEEYDLECYVHFWRGIGYLLGIQDQFNMCSGELQETRCMSSNIISNIVLPTLKNPSKDSDLMAKAYCDGVNRFLKMPLYSYSSIAVYVYEVMKERHSIKLNWYDTFRLYCNKFIVWLLNQFPGLALYMSKRSMDGFLELSLNIKV